MQIHLSPRNIRLTAAIHQYAAEKVEQLEELGAEIIAAHVVLSHDDTAGASHRYTVKIHLAVAGPDIHAEDADAVLYAAFDKVTSKLERQLRKRKTRLTDRKRSKAQRSAETLKKDGR